MAYVVVVSRTFLDPGSARQFETIQRRLKAGARPVTLVVDHFAREFKRSIDFDFRVGGRSPFVWAANARNTVAVKGHGRPLIGKGGSTRLRDATQVRVARGVDKYWVRAITTAIGEYNQVGVKPHDIKPRKAKMLRFEVAEEHGDFLQRRREASVKRRAGKRVRIPTRPGTKVVFARFIKAGTAGKSGGVGGGWPGIPARRFIVVREGLIREAWRLPLQAFLFRGVVPK
jgi:hypothetical protein